MAVARRVVRAAERSGMLLSRSRTKLARDFGTMDGLESRRLGAAPNDKVSIISLSNNLRAGLQKVDFGHQRYYIVDQHIRLGTSLGFRKFVA